MQQFARLRSFLFPKYSLQMWCIFIYAVTLLLHGLYGSKVIAFSQDQARDDIIMERAAASGQWLIGYGPKASVGNFYLPSMYYQFHLLFSVLTGHAPLTMHWVIIFVESATPVILFLLLRKVIDTQYAAAAAIAYGFSPLATIFSTFAWNPNMIPFFSTLAFYCFYLHLVERKRWPIILGALCIVISVNLHFQAMVIMPFAAITFLWSLKRDIRDFKYWLIGGALCALVLFPHFWFEYRSSWQNTRAIYSYFTTQHSHYFDRVSKLAFVHSFLPGFSERVLVGKNQPFFWIGRIVFFAGLSLLTVLSIKNKKYRWILIYWLTIFVMLRVYKGDKLDYYLSTLFILPFMLLGILLQKGKWVLIPLFLVIVFLAGKQIGKTAPNDGLANLKGIMAGLTKILPNQDLNMVYHDDDFINLYKYGFSHYTSIKTSPVATTIVDVCGSRDICEWKHINLCQISRTYTYSSLLKNQGKYEYQSSYKAGDSTTIVIGKLSSPLPAQLAYPPYVFEYGSDILEDK